MARERFRLPVAVHVFLLRAKEDGEGEEILLLRRANTGYEDGNYSVPAGHLDGDEEITAAAARELREEVGIRVAPEELTVIGVMHRRENDERIDLFLTARTWRGDPTNAEPAKCDHLLWTSPSALPPNTIPYIRHALATYHPGTWFTGFGWT